MTTYRSGAGSPDRTLELLWRAVPPDAASGSGQPSSGTAARVRRRRGPRQGLAVDAVISAAITLADGEGLDAVSMRRVAQTLGVAPMTLYTYVPGKSELLDLMLDTLYARMPRPRWGDQPWRTRVEMIAGDNRTLYRTHPWAAEVTTARPPLGPGLLAKYEHELRAFDGTGLDDVERDAALTFLLDFVRAAARSAAEVRAVRRESGQTEEQWWAANAPLLSRVVDQECYPTAIRVGAAAGAAQKAAYQPDRAYEFGLARVLDGLAVLVEESSRHA